MICKPISFKDFCKSGEILIWSWTGDSIPKYLFKFTFELIYIVDFTVTVRVVKHPKFKKNDMIYYHYPERSVKNDYVMEYGEDELVNMEFTLSKNLFDPGDIKIFEQYCNGDTF